MKSKKPPIRAMFGTNVGSASAHNRRVIIDAIRVNQALSRAELARATKLTKQAISNIVDELERDGLVEAQQSVKVGRGKPATPYRLASMGAFSIGLQIDRYVARLIVVNLVGDILLKRFEPLDSSDPEAGFDILVRLIKATREDLAESYPDSEDRLVGLGVAMPGPFVEPTNGDLDLTDDAFSMARWQRFPLVERLEEATSLAVSLQNDAAAAATAEKLIGRAHAVRNAICLYFGYGLGAGIILNGELYTGLDGNAGEIGLLMPSGTHAPSDALEHKASLASLCNHLKLDPSGMQLFSQIDRLLEQEDPALQSWMQPAVSSLHWLADMLELVFAPQAIILCGTAPSQLIQHLVDHVNQARRNNAQSTRKLPLQAGFGDPWTVAIGAAAEPISQSFDPRHSALLKQ